MTAVTESAVPERDPTRNREGGATHDAVDHRDSARGREVELPSRRCETHVAEHPQSVVMRGEHEIPRFRPGMLDVVAADAVDGASVEEVFDHVLDEANKGEDSEQEERRKNDECKDL